MKERGVSTDEVYRTREPGEIPWNDERPPTPLVERIESGTLPTGRAIDLGCGLGHTSRYLARNGYDVTGVDLSPAAIEKAARLADDEGLAVRFAALDLCDGTGDLEPDFDLAVEWFVLHHVPPENRPAYIAHVASLLRPGGLYLSVCFSIESPSFGGTGAVRETPLGTILYFSTEDEIGALIAPFFDVEELTTREVKGSRGIHRAICATLVRAERDSE